MLLGEEGEGQIEQELIATEEEEEGWIKKELITAEEEEEGWIKEELITTEEKEEEGWIKDLLITTEEEGHDARLADPIHPFSATSLLPEECREGAGLHVRLKHRVQPPARRGGWGHLGMEHGPRLLPGGEEQEEEEGSEPHPRFWGSAGGTEAAFGRPVPGEPATPFF